MTNKKYFELQDEHNVIRKCSRQKQAWKDGELIGIDPCFFSLSKNDEGYLSCSWLEYFSGNDSDRLIKTYKCMLVCMKGWTNVLLAKSNVSKLKECASKRGCKLRIINVRDNKVWPSYTKISGLPLDNSNIELLDALAHETSTELLKLPE